MRGLALSFRRDIQELGDLVAHALNEIGFVCPYDLPFLDPEGHLAGRQQVYEGEVGTVMINYDKNGRIPLLDPSGKVTGYCDTQVLTFSMKNMWTELVFEAMKKLYDELEQLSQQKEYLLNAAPLSEYTA